MPQDSFLWLGHLFYRADGLGWGAYRCASCDVTVRRYQGAGLVVYLAAVPWSDSESPLEESCADVTWRRKRFGLSVSAQA